MSMIETFIAAVSSTCENHKVCCPVLKCNYVYFFLVKLFFTRKILT